MSDHELVRVADVADVPPGTMRKVEVDGHPIALANVDGRLHAFGNECTHDGGPLAEGALEDGVVVCPWHFSRFCIRSGAVRESPAEDPIPVYDVTVDGQGIYVRAPR